MKLKEIKIKVVNINWEKKELAVFLNYSAALSFFIYICLSFVHRNIKFVLHYKSYIFVYVSD